MNARAKTAEVLQQTIDFKLDGKVFYAYDAETVLNAAKRHGIDIPHLCYKDGLRADGNCRACVVGGQRRARFSAQLLQSCYRRYGSRG